MSRLADRLSPADQLRSLREQADSVMREARPAAANAAETVRTAATDATHAVADPLRRALEHLPTVLEVIAAFRNRGSQAADYARQSVPAREDVAAYLPTKPTLMASVRPILLGMAIATAGYAAYRYARRH